MPYVIFYVCILFYRRVTERISRHRQATQAQLVRVRSTLSGLIAALSSLNLHDSPQHSQEYGSVACNVTSSSHQGGRSGSTSPYRHGDPSTAIHESLCGLYGRPFASTCYVVIDGVEAGYCNDLFTKLFYSSEEATRRFTMEKELPRKIIAR